MWWEWTLRVFAGIGALGVVVASVVAIWGLPVAVRSADIAQQAEERERKKDQREDEKEAEEEERLTVGPAIDIQSTEPNLFFSGGSFALPHPTESEEDLPEGGYMSEEYRTWFAENKGLPVNERSVRVTIFPIHQGTVVIQGMRITDRVCRPTRYTGTVVVPPSFGDSGGEGLPTMVAFDLREPVPRPWKMRFWTPDTTPGEGGRDLSGNAFAKVVYLDGGEDFDARAFDLWFFTGNQDCEFGVEVNATTAGRGSEWYRVLFPGRRMTYEVAGNPGRYNTSVVSEDVEGAPVLRGPRDAETPPPLVKGPFDAVG
ncbi:hypothetical protein CP967_06580 [Streptomyces nitrosporeus]|uniref:Uncharacterized protein n=1 Tax=Streptomyces nitrosporeus TaxID=28894 RepID=A0A5J6F5U9_9ACTN|nr:hypothetical protein [Streptomyces nitrosporeus]QEU71671.1 hypothetical protein CP967_06580 [Streptomyces nitrosporeus]GGY95229.1 hypothetical protein GCM10010327_27490 [Streptomyces nitrosporeus]